MCKLVDSKCASLLSTLGSYIYVEATYGSAGDTTRLYSPVFQMNSTQCLHLHYHMWGEHVGMMHIYLNVSRAKLNIKSII